MRAPAGVEIPRPDRFREKMRALRKGGAAKLHVVTDFDMTLTAGASSDPGIRNSSWGLLESSRLQKPEFIAEYKANYRKYSPVIWDDTIPYLERDRLMREWYERVREHMREHGVTRENLARSARSGVLLPRPGLCGFFSLARANNVPVVVFSAGLGDVIEEFLRFHGVVLDNAWILADFHEHDELGLPLSFRSGIIHPLNKNEAHAAYDVHAIASRRKNVLLMGDFEHDVHMADGEKHDTVLSVGFLNGKHEHLPRFRDVFDAVVLEDVGLDFPTRLLRQIGGDGESSFPG